MGRGPRVLAADPAFRSSIEAAGWSLEDDEVGPVDEAQAEIARVVELLRLLAERVGLAIEAKRFPLVLAGSCNSCLGTVAGARAEELGVVWFDAHADFDDPEENTSGFFDVMGLAMLTGRGWRALRQTIPGHQPIAERDVILAGVRARRSRCARPLGGIRKPVRRSRRPKPRAALGMCPLDMRAIQRRCRRHYRFDPDLDATGAVRIAARRIATEIAAGVRNDRERLDEQLQLRVPLRERARELGPLPARHAAHPDRLHAHMVGARVEVVVRDRARSAPRCPCATTASISRSEPPSAMSLSP